MIIDIIVILVILVSALISFLRGFIRECLTIIGTLGAFAAAYFFGPTLTPLIERLLGIDSNNEIVEPEKLFGILPYDLLATIIAYGSIFIIVIIALSLLSHLIAETAKSIGLGPLDRTLGVVFGIARGVAILGLLNLPLYIFAKGEENRPDFINSEIKSSSTYYLINYTSSLIETLIPHEQTQKIMDEQSNKIKEIDIAPSKEAIFDHIINKPKEDEKTNNTKEPMNTKGYNDDFRNKMDELFEEKAE